MPSTSRRIASGWSPAGRNGWCRRNGLPGKRNDLVRTSEISIIAAPGQLLAESAIIARSPEYSDSGVRNEHSPIFAAVEMAPRDPILGLTEAFNADNRTPTRSTSASASISATTARFRCSPPSRPPRRPASKPCRRAATSRSKVRPPTTRRCRSCCSATTSPLLADGRVITAQAWAAPARSRSAPTTSSACCRTPRSTSAIRAGKTTARCSNPPASRSRTTPTTMPPRAASISPA